MDKQRLYKDNLNHDKKAERMKAYSNLELVRKKGNILMMQNYLLIGKKNIIQSFIWSSIQKIAD